MPSYIPISTEHHLEKRWRRHKSVIYAKTDNIAQIYINELPDLVHLLPLAFIQTEQGFRLVAVTGLRTGENLLVSPEGAWLSSYLPATYRFNPFKLFDISGDENKALGIEESHLSDDENDEPIFLETGKLSETVNSITEAIAYYEATKKPALEIISTLEKLKLLSAWDITIDEGGTEKKLTGLYKVDELRLSQLQDHEFIDLKNSGALPVIYSQLFSLNNIRTLVKLYEIKNKEYSASMDNINQNDTFSFSGL